MISEREQESKLMAFMREYRQEIKFVTIFIVGVTVCFLLVYNDFVANNVVKPITTAEAFVASKVLNVIGYPNEQIGTRINGIEGNYFRMEVRNNCNGVFESIVFLMAFIAIQIPWRRKIGWMLIGFTIFHIINEIRLVSLFIVGSGYSKEWFDFFHETFWNYALVLLTLGIFIACAHQVTKKPVDKNRPAEAAGQ